MLMGPGRWGSSNILLGINVSYADISRAAALIEIASEKTGHAPELSFGTHFFQDLVESEIPYVAVFPEQPDARFNSHFFAQAPNVLPEILPEAKGLGGVLHLIDIPAFTGGLHAAIAADTGSRLAVCYLA